jgi:uncharacterized membrane protein required for colicin V production
MPLTWVDILLAVMILGWVILEVRRDFGRGLFDALAVLVSMRLTLLGYPLAARLFGSASSPNATQGWAVATLFVVLCALTLYASKIVHEATQWSMDTFDPIFGCLFGVTTGVMMAHMTVKILAMLFTTRRGLPPFLADSALGVELLYFKTYHQIADFLVNFRDRA